MERYLRKLERFREAAHVGHADDQDIAAVLYRECQAARELFVSHLEQHIEEPSQIVLTDHSPDATGKPKVRAVATLG
jgi:hypothetical protein